MYNLILHIQYLLRYHDCVILPGIGALMADDVPARIDMQAGVVMPPSREITFNASVCNNDGLLANSISRREGISFAEAQQILDREIQQLRIALAENGRVEVAGIGSLMIGEEGRTVFVPCDNAASRAMRRCMKPLPIAARSEATASSQKPRRIFSDKYYYIAVNKRLAHAAACLAGIVLCVAAALCIPSLIDTGTADYASVLPIKEVAGSISKTTEQPAKPTKAKPVVKQAEPKQIAEDKYYLIVGTFTTEVEIERFMKRHADSGYDMKILPGEKVTRIAVASAADKTPLIAMMRSDDLKSRFGGTWIWEKPKKVSVPNR